MKSVLDFCVPCLFGLEGLCADELKRLGYDNVKTENGRVMFAGTAGDIARANINLRTGERLLIVVGKTNARTFDELFEGVRKMAWEDYVPMGGAFPVKGHSLDSKLYSIPDCQRIIKKAVAMRLKSAFGIAGDILNESGAAYQIKFAIMDDIATLYLDTSGTGLHKRGYRPAHGAAPLRETLAAAMVKLSRYRGKEEIYDPFCGSGTIPIEAALCALNRAPGLDRCFDAMQWKWADKKIWDLAKIEARDLEYRGAYSIWGGDIDPKCIEISQENAKRAGVAEHIRFETADAGAFWHKAEDKNAGVIIITNPPYGERVMEKSRAQELYRVLGERLGNQPEAGTGVPGKMKMYILSSHTEFERAFGKKATKKRKLYNGMIKCDLFMYF